MQGFVACDQNLKPCAFRGVEQLSVFEACESRIDSRRRIRGMVAERMGKVLAQQNLLHAVS